MLAKVGAPVSAFSSSFGSDTPAPNQGIGSFFLTDDGDLSGLFSPALLARYNPPTAAASGVILDIDFGETFTIEALDADGGVIESLVIAAGDPGTGDGISTQWSFSRPHADVYTIRFKGCLLYTSPSPRD